MRTYTKTYNTVEGATTIRTGDLAYIKTESIKIVCREGIEYDIVTGTPDNRQVKHTPSTGELDFGTPHELNARVFVKYEH